MGKQTRHSKKQGKASAFGRSKRIAQRVRASNLLTHLARDILNFNRSRNSQPPLG